MGFAEASAVRSIREGRYAAEIRPGWDVVGKAHGGYLLAIAARAAAEACGRPDPATVTAHYLTPGAPGSAAVSTELVRSGRRFSTVQASLEMGDRRLLAMLGTFTELGGDEAPERIDGRPPQLPEPEKCTKLEPAGMFPPPYVGRVDMRIDPGAIMPTDGPLAISGYFRLLDGEPIDTLGLLMAVDAFPPVILKSDLPLAWVPTIELTAHVRARPAPGWLRCAFTTRFITGGYLEEDGEVWDSAGRLVAQSRQLALLPRG